MINQWISSRKVRHSQLEREITHNAPLHNQFVWQRLRTYSLLLGISHFSQPLLVYFRHSGSLIFLLSKDCGISPLVCLGHEGSLYSCNGSSTKFTFLEYGSRLMMIHRLNLACPRRDPLLTKLIITSRMLQLLWMKVLSNCNSPHLLKLTGNLILLSLLMTLRKKNYLF